ncbi:MAG: cytochrome c [Gloeobacteraceae cyanobacterium ES-bin-316]|nr:cytochrome c [Ferruginibacter sp.]
MKRLTNFPAIAVIAILILMGSCKDNRKPGSIYMPDMAYSRTFETYAELDSLKFTGDINNKGGMKIFFNEMPAAGTIKRGELFPYTLPNDSNGYKMSAAVVNPVDTMTGAEMSEAGRLYNINCGICHGEKGLANGPLAEKIGAVANLTADAYKTMADGTMFHSLTYGKNNMGSYASQLSRQQRWMVVKYVRTLQGKGGAPAAADSTAAKGADSTAVVKK